MEYCKGDRPEVDCILCEIVASSGKVTDLEIYRNDLILVCANLFPYNPGHLLIAPLRHIEDPRQMSRDEERSLIDVRNKTLDILDRLYQPQGYNTGFNIGDASGASIRHIHMHIVPRYHRELGFIDLIGGAKIIVEDPVVTQEKLRTAFRDQAG